MGPEPLLTESTKSQASDGTRSKSVEAESVFTDAERAVKGFLMSQGSVNEKDLDHMVKELGKKQVVQFAKDLTGGKADDDKITQLSWTIISGRQGVTLCLHFLTVLPMFAAACCLQWSPYDFLVLRCMSVASTYIVVLHTIRVFTALNGLFSHRKEELEGKDLVYGDIDQCVKDKLSGQDFDTTAKLYWINTLFQVVVGYFLPQYGHKVAGASHLLAAIGYFQAVLTFTKLMASTAVGKRLITERRKRDEYKRQMEVQTKLVKKLEKEHDRVKKEIEEKERIIRALEKGEPDPEQLKKTLEEKAEAEKKAAKFEESSKRFEEVDLKHQQEILEFQRSMAAAEKEMHDARVALDKSTKDAADKAKREADEEAEKQREKDVEAAKALGADEVKKVEAKHEEMKQQLHVQANLAEERLRREKDNALTASDEKHAQQLREYREASDGQRAADEREAEKKLDEMLEKAELRRTHDLEEVQKEAEAAKAAREKELAAAEVVSSAEKLKVEERHKKEIQAAQEREEELKKQQAKQEEQIKAAEKRLKEELERAEQRIKNRERGAKQAFSVTEVEVKLSSGSRNVKEGDLDELRKKLRTEAEIWELACADPIEAPHLARFGAAGHVAEMVPCGMASEYVGSAVAKSAGAGNVWQTAGAAVTVTSGAVAGGAVAAVAVSGAAAGGAAAAVSGGIASSVAGGIAVGTIAGPVGVLVGVLAGGIVGGIVTIVGVGSQAPQHAQNPPFQID